MYAFYYEVGVLLRAGSPLVSEQTWGRAPVIFNHRLSGLYVSIVDVEMIAGMGGGADSHMIF